MLRQNSAEIISQGKSFDGHFYNPQRAGKNAYEMQPEEQ
jgi:hypothetical protein